MIFLSTLSLRRATIFSPALPTLLQYFYPRSPCGERLHNFATVEAAAAISIHALLAESDHIRNTSICTAIKFLSTLSLRRATSTNRPADLVDAISIHALLAESDRSRPRLLSGCRVFLSTLSLRRATQRFQSLPCFWVFLSTLSLRRATATPARDKGPSTYFYPRSPCGERPHSGQMPSWPDFDFYPRSPCGERRIQRC